MDLLGIPSDFMAQTVYMSAEVKKERGRTIGTYSSDGSAWHTVAMYSGYSSDNAIKMADVRSFNKALNNLYKNIEKNKETIEFSSGLSLTNNDFDIVVRKLVNDIVASDSLHKKNGKYVLIISDIEFSTVPTSVISPITKTSIV